ncbi:MAG: type 1 glutamine amidotransferase domain-containing protein [Gammaproteobacteria bacterium]|nr:type 1 glutamine amidotransferase domain-containing protein [Gammaproteobacteria bacterium]
MRFIRRFSLDVRPARWAMAFVALVGLAFGLWACAGHSVSPAEALAQAQRETAFIAAPVAARRGKILAVVSSTAHFPGGKKKAGFELTELARAYYVFEANGYSVDIASPRGGLPPAMIDEDDMQAADRRFLADAAAQAKLAASRPLAEVKGAGYAAVYFVGGKGAMFDFPDNPDVQRLVREIGELGVVGAVCHGPAALLAVRDGQGRPWISGRNMTGFTNEEELFLIENARELFPYLLQDQAEQLGARFVAGFRYLDNVVVDGRLVTGQNPWSTWGAAEAMIRVLGHEPVARVQTAEEASVAILKAYREKGLEAARAQAKALPRHDKNLLRMHAVVAGMDGALGDAADLVRLAGW